MEGYLSQPLQMYSFSVEKKQDPGSGTLTLSGKMLYLEVLEKVGGVLLSISNPCLGALTLRGPTLIPFLTPQGKGNLYWT